MATSVMSLRHIILSCKANWSHLRSMCILASRIASSRDVIITILVASLGETVERVTQEVSRSTDVESSRPNSKIRIVGLQMFEGKSETLDDSFRRSWKALTNQEPVQCSYKLSQTAMAPKPSLVILDGFQLSWLEIIRSEPLPPPIIQWMMAYSAGFIHMCGPSISGGRSGEPMNRQGHDCNDCIRIPGMPPMTCYELNPQHLGDKASKIQIAEAMMTRFAEESDGLLTTSAPEYDSEKCLDAISAWIFSHKGRRTFHVGPMVPLIPGTREFSAKAIEVEIEAAPNCCGATAMQFLDKCLASHGNHSVFYISFGTEHWPSSLEDLDTLLHTLSNHQHPFILAQAYPSAGLPDIMKMKYENSGHGIILPFVPQQAVLAHEACGWFITHGGANGVIEALTQGVPMIGWPFAVDQPLNIAHMARNLDVGFELTKMRSNCCPVIGPRPSAELSMGTDEWRIEVEQVILATQTAIGQRKRKNSEDVGDKLALAWSESSGRGREHLSAFLDLFGI